MSNWIVRRLAVSSIVWLGFAAEPLAEAGRSKSRVFTGRDLRILHPSITLTAQSPREVIELLASRGLGRAWLMGGGKLAASFHADQLISRYIISVFPILLGSGIPVFAPHASAPNTLRFVAAKPFRSGIVQLTYEPAQDG